jgi:phosphoenolpyruvate synthase/pyruvate phosphate dikinase
MSHRHANGAVSEDTGPLCRNLTVLNVTDNILEAYKAFIASKYFSRAILYRQNFGLDDRDTPGVAGIASRFRGSGVVYSPTHYPDSVS